MFVAILLLLLIAILFGIGLAVAKVLLWIAAILFAVWLIGWFVGAGTTTGARRRWYAW
ncbi:MAG TPA: hydrophobic protein [Actinomycetota bacterium]|nr:hydrophobic protein [Actinomycetota bacterium]